MTSLVKTRASIIITHKGRQAVAICLNDIKKQNMRQNNNYASLNVPKDFIRVDVMKIKLIDVGMEVWLDQLDTEVQGTRKKYNYCNYSFHED